MILEADNLAITRTMYDKVFFNAFEAATSDGAYVMGSVDDASLFRTTTIDNGAYLGITSVGTGLWKRIGEVEQIPQSSPVLGNAFTVIPEDFADGIEISKNLMDDAMGDTWQNIIRQFGQMARVTQQIAAFGIFRGATTTTLTADGFPLGYASHPLIGTQGGVQSNIVPGPLSIASLKAALLLMRRMKNMNGIPMGATGATLVVPLALWDTALEITQSVLVSDSSLNTTNVFRNVYGLRVVTSPYLGAETAGGSDTNCFLIAQNTPIIRVVRQGVQTALRDWSMSTNRTYFYQGNFRETSYCPDWFGFVVIGS